MHGASKKEFLHRISMDEGPDAIQKRAKDFISILSEEHGLFAICGTIRETLSSTLIENGGLRARIDLIVELLSSKLKYVLRFNRLSRSY